MIRCKSFVAIICSLFGAGSFGQTMIAQAPLDQCRETAFYKIEIDPSLASWLTDGYANLRIVSEDGKQVPYLLEDAGEYTTREFHQYTVSEKKIEPGCCTKIIIHNSDSRPINNVHLRIKNADVYKTATLSGSDDRLNWFALKDKFYLDPVANASDVSELRILDFPLSNYKYYQLLIDDSTSAPLNILAVGFYKVIERRASYTSLPVRSFEVKDSASAKQTFIELRLDKGSWVDRIGLKAEGSPFFLRHGNLYSVSETTSKGRTKLVSTYLDEFNLSHEGETIIDLKGVKSDHLTFQIDNGDNPSLIKFDVRPLQLRRYAIAWLQAGKEYRIAIAEPKAASPNYDLAHFKSKLPVNMLSCAYGDINLIKKEEVRVDESLFQTKYLVWASIVAIMIVLGLMSIRMIRETKVSQ